MVKEKVSSKGGDVEGGQRCIGEAVARRKYMAESGVTEQQQEGPTRGGRVTYNSA